MTGIRRLTFDFGVNISQEVQNTITDPLSMAIIHGYNLFDIY